MSRRATRATTADLPQDLVSGKGVRAYFTVSTRATRATTADLPQDLVSGKGGRELTL